VTAAKKDCDTVLVSEELSVKRACAVSGVSRATWYRPKKDWCKADAAVIEAINAVLKKSPRAGFWKRFGRIKRKGHCFNHKRVYRVYCRMGLNLRRRTKRVLPKRDARPLEVVKAANRQWALDFMHDSLYCSKRYRALNVVDEGTPMILPKRKMTPFLFSGHFKPVCLCVKRIKHLTSIMPATISSHEWFHPHFSSSICPCSDNGQNGASCANWNILQRQSFWYRPFYF